jgi:hypothetical protein
MNTTQEHPAIYRTRRFARVAIVPLVLAVVALVGCLDEPEIDKRWTLVEFVDATPQPGQACDGGSPIGVDVRARVTYRRILTGFLVAEARYMPVVLTSAYGLRLDEHTAESAAIVDQVLANSVTAGRATKAVTGFDHLMQDIDLSFTAQAPAAMFSGGAATGAMFLVVYMAEGDEIELPGGMDSLLVTPFVSSEYEVLHTGFRMNVTPPGATP